MITECNAQHAKHLIETFAIPAVEKYLWDILVVIEHIDNPIEHIDDPAMFSLSHSDIIACEAGNAIARHDYDDAEAGIHRVFTPSDVNILGDLAVEAVAPNSYLGGLHPRERQLIFGR